jgi:hypothetical protein
MYRRRKRNSGLLVVLLMLALVYIGLLFARVRLTGRGIVDGSLGVVLGLYICSRPAANAIDLLFYDRGSLSDMVSGPSGITWLVLNLLVMLAGWLVIVLGAIRTASAIG